MKRSVCPTIYPYLEGKLFDSCFSQGYKQPALYEIWTRVAGPISRNDNHWSTSMMFRKALTLNFPTYDISFPHAFVQNLHHVQDVTQGQFLSRIQLVWIERFPFSKLVALPSSIREKHFSQHIYFTPRNHETRNKIPTGCFYLPNLSAMSKVRHRASFQEELNIWIQRFPFSRRVAITKLKSPVCPIIYSLPLREIVEFIFFPVVLALVTILCLMTYQSL